MSEIIGKIKLIGETQTFDSGFSKRQIVITTNEQYPQDIPIDFVKDKTEILNSYKIGQDVKVSINIRGNEYNGKYYVNLQGWRIESVQNSPKQDLPPKSEDAKLVDEEPDDLPF